MIIDNRTISDDGWLISPAHTDYLVYDDERNIYLPKGWAGSNHKFLNHQIHLFSRKHYRIEKDDDVFDSIRSFLKRHGQ